MNFLFRACNYPTASLTEMVSWNNLLSTDNSNNDAAFSNLHGVMSVGLFSYDMNCLNQLCNTLASSLCLFIDDSYFDGWMIGAYITNAAHKKSTGSE